MYTRSILLYLGALAWLTQGAPLNINLGAYSPALVVGDGEISFGGGEAEGGAAEGGAGGAEGGAGGAEGGAGAGQGGAGAGEGGAGAGEGGAGAGEGGAAGGEGGAGAGAEASSISAAQVSMNFFSGVTQGKAILMMYCTGCLGSARHGQAETPQGPIISTSRTRFDFRSDHYRGKNEQTDISTRGVLRHVTTFGYTPEVYFGLHRLYIWKKAFTARYPAQQQVWQFYIEYTQITYLA